MGCMRRAFLAAVIVALVLPCGSSAQDRPDFSGTWKFSSVLSGQVGGGGGGAAGGRNWATTLVITQTPDRIEVQGSAFQQLTQTATYTLDGKETTFRSAGDITTKATAVWDGNALVITARRSFVGPQGEVAYDQREVYSLVNGNLAVERTDIQQGKSTSRKGVYAKGEVPRAAAIPAANRRAPAGPFRRLANGHPDMQGYWIGQAQRAADSVEGNEASFGVGGGSTVIVDPPDGKVPYQPWAAAERERRKHDLYNDPEPHCFPSGVPRQMYVPGFPFQIFQTEGHFLILYEYIHARRVITMDRPHTTENVKFWQGDSIGKWEGDTLVVDSNHFTDKTWLDMDGNFYGEKGHIVERFTMLDANAIQYEAKIEDPEVLIRPWTMRFPLQRQTDAGYEIFEAACHEENRDLEHIKAAYDKGIK